MITEITERLYLGDIDDAANFNGLVICVLEYDADFGEDRIRKDAIRIPVLNPETAEFDVGALESVYKLVQRKLKRSNAKILIHCWAGQERSPMTMAWVLFRQNKFLSLKDAYESVKKQRKDVLDSWNWLPAWLFRV